MLPDLDLGVVVLTNSYYGGAGLFRAVSQTIVDRYMGLNDAGWTEIYLKEFLEESGTAAEVVKKVWETVDQANDDHIKVDDYIGIYKDNWFGKVRIYLKEDQLWFTSLRSPKLTGPMYYYKANAFAVPWEERDLDADAFVIFSLDEEGKALGITMKGISPDIDFSYDFQDLNFRRTSEGLTNQ
jgi:hypothetical protein